MVDRLVHELMPEDILARAESSRGTPFSRATFHKGIDFELWAPGCDMWGTRYHGAIVVERDQFGAPPVWVLGVRMDSHAVGYFLFEGVGLFSCGRYNGWGFQSFTDLDGFSRNFMRAPTNAAVYVEEDYRQRGFCRALFTVGLGIMKKMMDDKGILDGNGPLHLSVGCNYFSSSMLEKHFCAVRVPGSTDSGPDYLVRADVILPQIDILTTPK